MTQTQTLSHSGKEYTTQRLILGTHTSGEEENYLMIADVKLPTEEAANEQKYHDSKDAGLFLSFVF